MDPHNHDHGVRLAAFEFLDELTDLHGEALPWSALLKGFEFEGQRVPLLSQQGIFKPAVLSDMPLSIRTAPAVEGRARPYDDHFLGTDLFAYKYRGTDPEHRDNRGIRRAKETGTPLVYLFGLVPGWYAASYPAYVVGDDRDLLCFTIQVDDARAVLGEPDRVSDATVRRAYCTAAAKRRLHQQGFRMRVLRAYRECCAVCRLRHPELLDAAHIVPDSDPRGDPVVPNGLSLCKLHHAAFDRHFLGVRPDLTIELREDLLLEEDGPMLEHGLQGFEGKRILVPRSARLKPDQELLEVRYERFRSAG